MSNKSRTLRGKAVKKAMDSTFSQRSSARLQKIKEASIQADVQNKSDVDLVVEVVKTKAGRKRKDIESKTNRTDIENKVTKEPKSKKVKTKMDTQRPKNETTKKVPVKKRKKPVTKKRKEINKNYEDILDSTPFKDRKKITLPKLCLGSDSSEDSDYEEVVIAPSKSRINKSRTKKTSKVKTSSKTQIPLSKSLQVRGTPVTGYTEQCSVHLKDENTSISSGKKVKFDSSDTENKVQKICPITACVGTLKRKKQIKEYLDNLDQGHEDNIWDSTPFKNRKRIKVPDLMSDSDDEYSSYSVSNTPLPKTPMNRFRPCGPMDADNTPGMDVFSPVPEQNRKDMDRYVWKIQQRRKHGKYKPCSENKEAKKTESKWNSSRTNYRTELTTPTNLQDLFTQDKAEDLFINSDEEEDDYFTPESDEPKMKQSFQ